MIIKASDVRVSTAIFSNLKSHPPEIFKVKIIFEFNSKIQAHIPAKIFYRPFDSYLRANLLWCQKKKISRKKKIRRRYKISVVASAYGQPAKSPSPSSHVPKKKKEDPKKLWEYLFSELNAPGSSPSFFSLSRHKSSMEKFWQSSRERKKKVGSRCNLFS